MQTAAPYRKRAAQRQVTEVQEPLPSYLPRTAIDDFRDVYLAPKVIGRIELYRQEKRTSRPLVPVHVGPHTYEVPGTFPELIEEIQMAIDLFEMPDNWDDEGATAILPELTHQALEVVAAYARSFSDHQLTMPKVEINPVVNGTIDVAFYAPHASLLMNIRPSDEGGYIVGYFGGRGKGMQQEPIKGKTEQFPVASVLWEWMKNNLVQY